MTIMITESSLSEFIKSHDVKNHIRKLIELHKTPTDKYSEKIMQILRQADSPEEAITLIFDYAVFEGFMRAVNEFNISYDEIFEKIPFFAKEDRVQALIGGLFLKVSLDVLEGIKEELS